MRAFKKILKSFFFTLCILLAALSLTVYWAAKGIQQPQIFRGEFLPKSGTITPSMPQSIRILTWNIAYGHGLGSAGTDYHQKSPEEYKRHLQQISQTIINTQADIVLFQEIDFDSKRSHHINQLGYFSQATGLPYQAQAISWDARYVPFPYWPIKNQFGKMLSGGAVLSRFPIVENEVTLLPKPAENAWWYNLFYLFRYLQNVKILIGSETWNVINVHLEAFKQENRMEHAKILASKIEELEKAGARVLVAGGDMNTVPPNATKKSGFSDDPRDNYSGDQTYSIVSEVSTHQEIIPPAEYKKNEPHYLTFPSNQPTRRLDYLFLNKKAALRRAEFLRTGEESDHTPILIELILPPLSVE